jgi:phosphohistidine phosphatase
MKTLILVRHAKSDWSHEGLGDLERPLNERGKKDAPEMAKRTRKRIHKLDLMVSSNARRAKKTAKYFAEEYKYRKEDIRVEPKLYEDVPSAYAEVILSLSDKTDTVAFFAHSPTITDYANSLCHVHTDSIPTCGVFAVQADVDNWTAFARAEKKFLFYDYPKNPLADL